MEFNYTTENTCSTNIKLDIEGNVVRNIVFTGGCNGNLKTIPILVDGWTVEQIEEKCKGITCGRRPTSCADQLARAVRAAYEASKEECGTAGKALQGQEECGTACKASQES